MALLLAMLWGAALASFAAVSAYPLALALLFIAASSKLAFGSMTQTLVQMNAPARIRGRVIGLFNISALGLRAFSGVTVGLLGSFLGVHWSLGLSALAVLSVTAGLLYRFLSGR
jgi:hypothetical protein